MASSDSNNGPGSPSPSPPANGGETPSFLSRLRGRLFAAEDISSLVYFRIIFGLILLYEAMRCLTSNWILRQYIEPVVHFTYYGFDWVRPWPGIGMYIHFAALAVLAFCITIGLCYRLSVALFFLGFTYVFLLDQASYLNHFYFVCLVSFSMIFIPAHRLFSVDARLFPSLRSQTAPAWGLWLLRTQMGIVYFYGGIAKLNWDWFRGEPVRTYLRDAAANPVFGFLAGQEWAVYLVAYGGLLFDLLVVPCLLWRKTRPYAFVATALFHLNNHFLFDIGIFPWFSLGMTALFFSPDWPRRLLAKIGIARPSVETPLVAGEPVAAPTAPAPSGSTVVFVCLMAFVAIQLLVPLRHWLYPGDVNWTDEGHRFSWRMRLRNKVAKVRFIVTFPDTGETVRVDPRVDLTERQRRVMYTRPDMILQYCHYLAEDARKAGHGRVEVRAQVRVSLNQRPEHLMIDPEVDLAAQPRNLKPAPWILPLPKDEKQPAR